MMMKCSDAERKMLCDDLAWPTPLLGMSVVPSLQPQQPSRHNDLPQLTFMLK